MTPDLMRAARGLLNWQQQDLAAAADLSLSAINSFERGLGKTRASTVRAAIAALEKAGVEFFPNGALRRADEIMGVRQFSGPDFIFKMNDDLFAAVRNRGQEVLTCSVDENFWFTPEVKKSSENYYRWREKMGIKEYVLVAEGNTIYAGPRQAYRFLPPELIGKITYVIYADRIAYISWRKKQVYILRGSSLIEPFREQFKFLWRLAKKA